MTTPALRVEGLSFRYRGRKRPALQGVSLRVEPGETLLVLGPSGCGKSTLALCLNGLIPHSLAGELTGRVVVGEVDVRSAPVAELARTVGMVFQDADAQFCMLRVDDEIAFGLENLRVPAEEMPARISRALHLVRLDGRERTRIDRLSGGERQRLALACVLAMEPPVLVFDEPTSNLDPAGAEDVFEDIARLKAVGQRTIVIVEHRLDHLMGMVDRVLVLGQDGTVLAIGAPAEILRQHADELDASGVWIPQVSEAANRLIRRGLALETYPTTVAGAVETFGNLLKARGQESGTREAGTRDVVTPRRLDDERRELGLDHEDHETTRKDREKGTASAPGFSRFFASFRDLRGPDVLTSPTIDPSPAIEISRLTYRYPTGQLALREVNLTIPAGCFAAIVGPNGAGKSTLAQHLIGSIRPERGTVRVCGRDVRTISPSELARLVGYVFQNPEHQFVAQTVFDELAFGLRPRHVPEPEIQMRVEAMLDDFGLAALGPANPFTLSHGEKRRLSVATMLILGQQVLVLDEPTFGQDRQNTEALLEKLTDLNRHGRTIVMITHDVRLVAEYAQRVAVFVDGTVAFDGPVPRLFSDPSLLDRAHLVRPPLLELSHRLAEIDPSFPLVAAIEDFVDSIAERPPTPRPLLREAANGRLDGAPVEWDGRSGREVPRS